MFRLCRARRRPDDVDVNRLRCQHCGEIVGVYEPARLVLSDGTNWRGSPLTFDVAVEAHGAIVVHERCYKAFDTEARADAEP